MYLTNTPYTVILKSNIDLSAATDLEVHFCGPYYWHGIWSATANLKDAVFDINIPRAGTYKMQLEVTIDGNVRRSNFFSVNFTDPMV